ncbi:BZ3500_MvSof-1268-A1-R1_Chr5-1g07576 [Microbotryum saponariae]|uniref:BZ3500_MvSof-1268-A1-R1_Chr5-1g07576 protein n=1 Tax=Microbotryum saponariae TaxID=289078 RepID=A0A2X0KE07_9BASI|nr:BZ3500_MvSof-1268-A1-R1_Chr5-1g07576 [Microbotryum saponariae]SDA05447.1 BZ3501_MvSof-1269-A2-R1_Chr5-2g07400 [Microbotryum saponariae]
MSSSAALRQRVVHKVDKNDDAASTTSSSDSDDLTYGDFPPFTPPQFTVKDVLGAIPAHCFERSALRSSTYVVADFSMLAVLFYAATHIDILFGSNGTQLQGAAGVVAKWAAWSVYWVLAGWVMTGIWIIGQFTCLILCCAHECGHQSFSPSKTINNTVGLVLHSFVLVPYHSWRISHAKHHAATGHMTRDEVFVPATKSEKVTKAAGTGRKVFVENLGAELDELLEDAPAYRLFHLIVQQLFGWPAYLFSNASGQNWYPKGTNHFDPNSLIFDARHRQQVLISDAGLIAMLSALTWFGFKMGGFSAVVKYYGIPYLFVNHWLVMITYLQHTDPMLPHYRANEWNFQRGAICTIDRNMLGPVGPYLMHGICETHVAHHVCSKIPHYHAWEATEALKEFLGEHYQSTDENMFVSLWKNFRTCRYVDDEGDVVFFRDALGRTSRKVVPADAPSDSGVEVN